MSTFDSTKRLLPDILADISKGKIQLPDFQRGWVWDDQHIRGLLVSVARSFPVGAVMLLETGGAVKFQVRPVEGVASPAGDSPAEQLILDGQQRLTTLTQVLATKNAVVTRTEKGKTIRCHYYWNIEKALQDAGGLEDSIEVVDQNKVKQGRFGKNTTLDLSTTEKECKSFYFPCDQTLNSNDWEAALFKHAPNRFAEYMQFRERILDAFRRYQLPVIQLGKSTTKEAVCLVFEKVNTGGVPLNVFELLTATYAADGFNLRDDWYGSIERKVSGRQERLYKDVLLSKVTATDFLQAVSMLHTLDLRHADLKNGKTGNSVTSVSADRAAILDMPLSAYRNLAAEVEQGFIFTGKFLRKQCVMAPVELPYQAQLPPLASILVKLKDRWQQPRIYEKLSTWYWCGVMGEMYSGATETRMAHDVEELLQWVENDSAIPGTVVDASFNPDRLDRMVSRASAAYKGLNVLVLREGAKDFFLNASVQELISQGESLDIHHIFPQAWCDKNGVDRALCNSVVNKTPISMKTNRMIGGSSPSVYLKKLQSHAQVQMNDAQMDAVLSSHLIDGDVLRKDDFSRFYSARKAALVRLIERAMKKGAAVVPGEYDAVDDEGVCVEMELDVALVS